MKWLIDLMASAAFFAAFIILSLLLFNSFMTIAVAQTNHMLDRGIGILTSPDAVDNSGDTGLSIEKAPDGGLIIRTKDGSMKLTGEGPEIPSLG